MIKLCLQFETNSKTMLLENSPDQGCKESACKVWVGGNQKGTDMSGCLAMDPSSTTLPHNCSHKLVGQTVSSNEVALIFGSWAAGIIRADSFAAEAAAAAAAAVTVDADQKHVGIKSRSEIQKQSIRACGSAKSFSDMVSGNDFA